MPHSRKFKITYTATFRLQPKSEAYVWVALPTSGPGQKINKISLSFPPSRIYQDRNGNSIVHTRLQESRTIQLSSKIEATLQQYAIKTKSLRYPKHTKLLKTHTKAEPFLEQPRWLKFLAKKIKRESTDNLHALRLAFQYTINSFTYGYPVPRRGVKNLQPKHLKGDCGEYTAFFVALCRVMGIPAQPMTGFVIGSKGKLLEHAWASVYVPQHGWRDIDTQYAALGKNPLQATKKYFLARSDYRIAFSNGYNLPLHPVIPPGFDYSSWQRQCLPVSRKSAQVLQPIVFAHKGKMRFSDVLRVK